MNSANKMPPELKTYEFFVFMTKMLVFQLFELFLNQLNAEACPTVCRHAIIQRSTSGYPVTHCIPLPIRLKI